MTRLGSDPSCDTPLHLGGEGYLWGFFPKMLAYCPNIWYTVFEESLVTFPFDADPLGRYVWKGNGYHEQGLYDGWSRQVDRL